jgi:hypothetical protein
MYYQTTFVIMLVINCQTSIPQHIDLLPDGLSLVRPTEQVADAEAMLDLANALVSSSKVENRDGPTPSEFITALFSKFGAKASPLVDSMILMYRSPGQALVARYQDCS